MTIRQRIQAYMSTAVGEHNRHRSWERCYAFFQGVTRARLLAQRDAAAPQLGFF